MKNWVNRFLLAILLFPAGLYKRVGVNLIHLRAILHAKLTMDDRRAGTLYKSRNQKKDKEFNFATLMTMLMCIVMGCILLVALIFGKDLTRMTAYFTLYIFILALFLITDFTDVLIDARDNFIILPKPVNDRTFLVARLLHIVIHVSKICIPMALPFFIAILVTRGWWGACMFVVMSAMLTLLTIFIVNAIYLAIIRVFSPDKFKSIIGSVQIWFTVIVFASYQMLPRLIDTELMVDFDVAEVWAWWLAPSYWFAHGWMQLSSLPPDAAHAVGLVLSMTTPLLCLWLMVKKLAPAFQQKIALIGSGSESEKGLAKKKLRDERKGVNVFARVANWVTREGVERASYLFTWQLMARNREFKIKVYPQFGYLLVFVIVMLFTGSKRFTREDLDNANSMRYMAIILIYASGFMYLGALQQLPFSRQFRAAWVFFITPLSSPGMVLRGAAKAMMIKFAVPSLILIGIAGTSVMGLQFLPNIFLGFGNLMLVNAVVSLLTLNKFPFSVPVENVTSGDITFKTVLRMIFLPLLGFPHYFIFNYTLIVLLAGIATTTAAFFVLRGLREIKWKDVDPVYE